MINDDKFIQKSFEEPKAAEYNKDDLEGILERDWPFRAQRTTMPEDDPLPRGTRVEFTLNDGTELQGKVASKSGDDYIVEVSRGESYLIPPGKLQKITVESQKVREALARESMPTIQQLSDPTIEMVNRRVVRIAYRGKYPSDDNLRFWASDHYPDWALVDAIHKDGEIGLIFEVKAQIEAAEDPKPQGGDQQNRGVPLSSEEIEGSGVTAEGSTFAMGDVVSADTKKYESSEDLYNRLVEAGWPPAEWDDYQEVIDTLPEGLIIEEVGSQEWLVYPQPDMGRGLVTYDGMNIAPEEVDPPDAPESDTPENHWMCDCESINDLNDPVCWYCGNEKPQDKKAQLGEPGAAEAYEDLNKAARWVLARFNDSNPEYFAVPQESEMAGEGDNRIVRLSFTLQTKDEDDQLGHLYISRSGALVSEAQAEGDMQPVRGFVQVDAEANLPMVMIEGPMGPQSVQEYGFDMVAKVASDMCAEVAGEVYAQYGSYSAEAQAEFDARLTKLGVDDKTKKYWSSYFKDYGKSLTRDIPRKKYKAMIACRQDGIDTQLLVEAGVALDAAIDSITLDNINKVAAEFGPKRKTDPNLSIIRDTTTWAMEVAQRDPKMYEAVHGLVYNFLGKNPGFLQQQLETSTVDEYAMAYTLMYALRQSPKALRQFRKHLNQYYKRWEKGLSKELSQEGKEWRAKERRAPKEKKKEKGEGPSEISEEPPFDMDDDKPSEKKQPPPPPEEAELAPEDVQEVIPPEHVVTMPEDGEEVIKPTMTSTSPVKMEYQSMRRKADPAPGPTSHNAPGKDDKKDYDHKEHPMQPSSLRTRFEITKMYSTTSSQDNGYVFMDIAWNPDEMAGMHPSNIMQNIVSYLKRLESDKYFHDFGVMGKPKIVDMDADAGVARVKVRCSETRGVMTLTYGTDLDKTEPVPTYGIR